MAKADTFDQVAPDLWFWQAYEESVRCNLSSCAVRAKDGLVLVDPIDLTPEGFNELEGLGSVAAVVLTNGNHGRSAMRYRKRFSVPILAHADALGELEIPVDGTLRVDRAVGGSLRVINLQGGGAGEIALYDSAGRLHFGDALINLDPDGLSVLPAKYCSDYQLLQKSLQALLPLNVEIMTFAHGVPVVTDAAARLEALVRQMCVN